MLLSFGSAVRTFQRKLMQCQHDAHELGLYPNQKVVGLGQASSGATNADVLISAAWAYWMLTGGPTANVSGLGDRGAAGDCRLFRSV